MNAVELYEDNAGNLALCLSGGEYDLWITGDYGSTGTTFRACAEHLLLGGLDEWVGFEVRIAALQREIANEQDMAIWRQVVDDLGYAGIISYLEIDRHYNMVARYTLGHVDVIGTANSVIRNAPGSSARTYLGIDAPKEEV